MKTPEGYIKEDVRKYLKSIGVYFFSPATFGFGGSGTPDICACIQGRFVGIEVKREGKAPTAIQNRRLSDIRKAGGIAIWGDSTEMILQQLKQKFGFPNGA